MKRFQIDEKLSAYRKVEVTHLPSHGTPLSEEPGCQIWTG
jgi:hypothetical protein